MPGVRVLPSPASACCVASTAAGVRPLHLPARLLSEYSAHLAQTPFELLMLSSSAANKLDGLTSQARRVVDSAGDLAKQGIAPVTDAAKQTRSSIAGSPEALVGYTKDYPLRALMIAAVSGALLWSVLRAVATSRRS